MPYLTILRADESDMACDDKIVSLLNSFTRCPVLTRAGTLVQEMNEMDLDFHGSKSCVHSY
jgi:hypothetical protein